MYFHQFKNQHYSLVQTLIFALLHYLVLDFFFFSCIRFPSEAYLLW